MQNLRMYMSWRRYAFNEVKDNNWAQSINNFVAHYQIWLDFNCQKSEIGDAEFPLNSKSRTHMHLNNNNKENSLGKKYA